MCYSFCWLLNFGYKTIQGEHEEIMLMSFHSDQHLISQLF